MSSIASRVASSCAASRKRSSTRHTSRIRTRGGECPISISRSINQSGWGYDPTTVVGRSGSVGSAILRRLLFSRRWRVVNDDLP